MARPPRLNLAGGLYHVIQRGNNRQPIVLADPARHAFLARLARFIPQVACRLHADGLMDPHLHLLVETRQANLSAWGQRLFASYALWFNRHHRRVGPVFPGRFKSFLVEQDAYRLPLSRDLHLSPVKARLVTTPEPYRWSSMRTDLPRGPREAWVHTTTLAYVQGHRPRDVAYVSAGRGEACEPLPLGQRYLGSEGFAEAMDVKFQHDPAGRTSQEGPDGCPARLVAHLSRGLGVSLPALQRKAVKAREVAEANVIVAYLLRHRTLLTYPAIGQGLGGISGPAVAQVVREVERTPRLRARAEQLIDTYDT